MKYDYKDFIDYRYNLDDFMSFLVDNIIYNKTDEINDFDLFLKDIKYSYLLNKEYIENESFDFNSFYYELSKKDYVYIDFLLYRNNNLNCGINNDLVEDLRDFFNIYVK